MCLKSGKRAEEYQPFLSLAHRQSNPAKKTSENPFNIPFCVVVNFGLATLTNFTTQNLQSESLLDFVASPNYA